MSDKRITVWVQRFKGRKHLVLQWIDPDTGKRKSKSAETTILDVAETKRTELEYELNHGLHKEASRMSWEKFRELFEDEYVSGLREDTRDGYSDSFDAFERLMHPSTLRGITERTISAYVGTLRRQPGYKGGTMQESTVKLRLQHLRTAFNWAAKQKMIPECPAFPSIRPPRRKPQPVPVESFERMLLKATDDNMHAFILAGWLGGLRLNEAIALEWEETDEAPYLDLAGDRIGLPGEGRQGRRGSMGAA